jgi:hypothetical protein
MVIHRNELNGYLDRIQKVYKIKNLNDRVNRFGYACVENHNMLVKFLDSGKDTENYKEYQRFEKEFMEKKGKPKIVKESKKVIQKPKGIKKYFNKPKEVIVETEKEVPLTMGEQFVLFNEMLAINTKANAFYKEEFNWNVVMVSSDRLPSMSGEEIEAAEFMIRKIND